MNLLEQQITFGKHKGRTFADLLENEREYLEWLAYKSDNERWAPVAKEVLETEGATNENKSNSDSPACYECGQVITQAVKTFSEKNFGLPLCRECQDAYRKFSADNNQEEEYNLSDIELTDASF